MTDQYDVFVRTWWRLNPNFPGNREPKAGRKRYLARGVTKAEAHALCDQYNATHNPGFLSRKAEFMSAR